MRRWFWLLGLLIPLAVVAASMALAPVINGAVLCAPERCTSYTQILQPIPNTRVEQVEFRAPNGNKMYGVYFKQHKARYTVLLNHDATGNMITALPLAMAMIEGGCSVFIYDYEGFGMSEGTASLDTMVADGDAAFDCAMNQLRIKPSHIIAGGSGLGSCVANVMVDHNPVSGLIMIDAPNRVNDIVSTKTGWWTVFAPRMHDYETRVPSILKLPSVELTTHGGSPEALAGQINTFIRKF